MQEIGLVKISNYEQSHEFQGIIFSCLCQNPDIKPRMLWRDAGAGYQVLLSTPEQAYSGIAIICKAGSCHCSGHRKTNIRRKWSNSKLHN